MPIREGIYIMCNKALFALFLAMVSLSNSELYGAPSPLPPPTGLSKYVNPYVDTNPGSPNYGLNNSQGDTFPGPVAPTGMVQFSPDTIYGSRKDAILCEYGSARLQFVCDHYLAREVFKAFDVLEKFF